jgi:hypothetical protein
MRNVAGSELVGPGSDITSKRGFFASLFECNGELKRFPPQVGPEGTERKTFRK